MHSVFVRLAVLISFAISPAFAVEPADIGSRLELFVDHSLIESMDGVELRLNAPIKAPRPKSPLPERHYITVIRDGDLFRAYWRDSTAEDNPAVRYAESLDGHEWEFPELGIHEVDGTRKNNVILANEPDLLHNFAPFLDTRPGVPENEKYKALAGHPGPGDKRSMDVSGKGLYAFFSGDGIHWRKGDEVVPYLQKWRHAFDSSNVSFWSEAEQCYICYFRTWTDPERLRSVSRTTSKDFRNWSDPVEMNPNLPGEHLYTTQTHSYFRAPHIYIALPTRYVPGRGDAPEYDTKEVNATDILLMSTRAGSEKYDRLFTEAFIRPGLDPERWINRANYVAQNVVPTAPKEMSIYHRSGDRYTLRTDGFVSVHAGSETGELLTKPVSFEGKELLLNASTSAVGDIRVALLDAEGNEFSGFGLSDCKPLYGDDIGLQVEWKNGADTSSLAGQPVQLKFQMKESDLFSYRFAAE